jgi:hypothetical protein
MRGETQTLFAQADLGDWLSKRCQDCKDEVLATSEQTLLHADAGDWAARLAQEFSVESVVVHADRMEADDLGEIQVDVSHERSRAISDPSRPFFVAGRKVVARIPFSGDETLLRLRASRFSMSPPRAAIGQSEVLTTFEYPADRRPDITAATTKLIAEIEKHLGWQQADIERHNGELAQFARQIIEHRRERVLADLEHLDGLGIPIRKAADVPSTYAAPGITRRPTPKSEPAKSSQVAVPMHPTLVGEFYAHILDVVGAMARGMERTPGNYANWAEEQLRDALLVLLNTHYEGQATGETFNGEGRTDIIIRCEDRNLFVAECKWWSGAAAFAKFDGATRSALDQLLSYTTWRDAKLALIVYVDRKDMERVLNAAKDALAAHPAFKHWIGDAPEGEFRCRVLMPGHQERHADLAVLFVHLPCR